MDLPCQRLCASMTDLMVSNIYGLMKKTSFSVCLQFMYKFYISSIARHPTEENGLADSHRFMRPASTEKLETLHVHQCTVHLELKDRIPSNQKHSHRRQTAAARTAQRSTENKQIENKTKPHECRIIPVPQT